MEGQTLLSLVKGQVYNADLRNQLTQMGLRRIGNNQWISRETAARYELIMTGDEEQKVVTGVDIIDKNTRVHLFDPEEERAKSQIHAKDEDREGKAETSLHHKTLVALARQRDVSHFYLDLINAWNYEIDQNTQMGKQLKTLVSTPFISFDNFFFLPSPLADGEYLFATIREGKAASMHAWLELPEGRYVVPTDGTEDGALDSLQCGRDFHKWEAEHFETAAAAGQFAIKALNNSKTTFAQAIRKLLGKENSPISRNDFYRNRDNVMCRVEIHQTESGLVVTDVPVQTSMADCIESLLAPYQKAKALDLTL